MKNSLLVFLFLLLTLKGYSQSCILSVNISSSSPAICSGSTILLTATPSGGTAPFTYAWNTGETTQTIPINKVGTYTVTVTDKTPGCQPVKQSITIAVGVVPNAPTATGQIVCRNSQATLTATAPGGTYQWYDAPTGGNFLASGDTYITPPIAANTIFYVQTTLSGCTSLRSAVPVTIYANPGVIEATICSGSVASLSATGGDSYQWYDVPTGGTILSTAATFVTPVLTANTPYYVSAVTNGCVSSRVRVFAFVTPPPAPPTASNTAVCSGVSANLHASAAAGVIDWYTTPTGGTSLISSPDYTTPPLTVTTTYYTQATLNDCASARIPVTVTVNPIPPAPAISDVTICSGTSAALSPTGPGGTYQWYDSATGGSLLATGNTFNTPALSNTTTYYVQTTSGCISPRSPVTVNITPPPAAPTASAPLVCSGSPATLTITSPGDVFQWFDAPTGGNLLSNHAAFVTPPLTANTTYYAQVTVGVCVSPRTAVAVFILPLPAAPTAAPVNVCSGSPATLSAAGGTGNYEWYDSATGGNLLSSSQVFVTPALVSTTTYYVQSLNNNCSSARVPVIVTVNSTPVAPTASGTTVCPGSSANLTASAASGSIEWYDALTGGNLLMTGSAYSTPVLFANTTYYVQNTTGTCSSARRAVTVAVTPLISPQFRYASGTFCLSGTNPTPVINNPSGGTFSASPAGLVFVSTTTGQINLAASTPGNYIISFAGGGICPRTTSAKIAIVTVPDAQFSYSGPFCPDAVNPFPVFPAGSSAGVFTASPAGLVFVNPSTGEINLSASTPGTYTITNTIAASGSCLASTNTATVTIDKLVVVGAGPDQIVQSGFPVQLAGSISGGTTNGTWSGGTGSFSDPSIPNPVYTPGAGETSATLTLLSTDPPGPCGPRSDKMVITFSPAPPSPTVSGSIVCEGGSTTLSATAPGGIYQWFDAATAGNLLFTGPVFTTPALLTTTTYYVRAVVGGLVSARAPVTVTVTPVPTAPVVSGPPVCMGTPATLTASGSTGTYEWYDAPAGGNLVSVNNPFITPNITGITTYYVQATTGTCSGPRTRVDVSINPAPTVSSVASGSVCSGTAQSYTITSNVAGATFTWDRAAVAGITNPAVSNQTSGIINETLINTGSTPVNVTYIITPSANGCSGQPFNYMVTVNPAPVVTSGLTATICSGTTDNYAIAFNMPGTTFIWKRAAVAGISNLAVSGQTAATIREVLFNTTSSPIDVTYVFNYTNGACSGVPFNFVITVNPSATVTSEPIGTICSGTAQNYVITSDVPGSTYTWSRAVVTNISNPAVTNVASGTINEILVNTSAVPVSVRYIITPISSGCPGNPFTRTVFVTPQPPKPVANSNTPVCLGSTVQLRTPAVPKATYFWTGPNGYTSVLQNPDILSVTAADAGTYNLYVTVNGCSSVASPVDVIINPLPIADAGPDQTVCVTATAVQLAGKVGGGTTTGVWSSSRGSSSSFPQQNNKLDGVYVPSAADIAAGSVVLTLTSTSPDDCKFATDSMTITFTSPVVTSRALAGLCTGTAQNYTITSDVPTATFSWSRAAVAGISNPAVSGQTSSTITETLFNPTATPINVDYIITANDNGCIGKPFTYTVKVNPTPLTPTITSNTSVCVTSDIQLQTPAVANATYAWTGPNGFTSPNQNPVIPGVSTSAAGTYSLVVTVNGCSSPTATIDIKVNELPIADAGKDFTVCPTVTSVQLAGSVKGGTNTGTWLPSGTGGTFSPNTPAGTYFPSAQDVAAGSVVLTLTSIDNCTISTSSVTIKFQLLPGADAGPDQEVCAQGTAKLAGKIFTPGGGAWKTSGSGSFIPSASQLDAVYNPSAADVKNGTVTLTLTANSPGTCFTPLDQMTLKLIPPPTVNAGGTRFVLRGNTITLKPTVSDENVTYLWTPNTNISDNTAKNPVITGSIDITYTLRVTDSRGCVSFDQTNIKVSPALSIPSAFTPNGDGVNDIWNIYGLAAYEGAAVDVFDRYGQKVFHSIGYGVAWDGTISGKQLPFGAYYYVIDTKVNGLILSGVITIVR